MAACSGENLPEMGHEVVMSLPYLIMHAHSKGTQLRTGSSNGFLHFIVSTVDGSLLK
jgi:hypothetical protein